MVRRVLHHKPHRRRRRRGPPGTPPGTIRVDPQAPPPTLRVMAYDAEGLHEAQLDDLKALPSLLARWEVTWLNVDGLGDAETIRAIGRVFGLHNLALEDVANTHQRAKVEQYPDHLFLVLRMIERQGHIESDQLSLFLGPRFVVTFQERPGDNFDPVRQRLRQSKGRIRQAGSDYLAYCLIDAVIDAYFPIIEDSGERLDELEDEVMLCPEQSTIGRLHEIRRELLAMRRAIWPLREAVTSLYREPRPLIREETRVYLRDCYDHTVEVIELLETYRELGGGLMETYLSSLSNRTNEVMKILTIIATIFIPLTFIAGLYGMNFNTEVSPWNMPELGWYWGYPACLVLMLVVAAALLVFFRRRGWLGGKQEPPGRPTPGARDSQPRDTEV